MVSFTNELTVDEFNALRYAVGWKTMEQEKAVEVLGKSVFTTVARIDNRAIGMGRVISANSFEASIFDVAVEPELQGQGIGGQIMNQIMNYLEASLDKNQLMMVNLLAAQGKEGFYRKYGFVEKPMEGKGIGMINYIQRIG